MISIIDTYAQDSKITFNYREYNSKNDFYGRNIGAFYQDSLGFMWFGCEGGLYRHDGINIKQMLNLGDSLGYNAVGNPPINCIIEDDSGFFWFGYSKYLIKFNPKTLGYKVFTIIQSPEWWMGQIFNILMADSSILWLGTTRGLIRFDSKKEIITDTYNTNPQDMYFTEKWQELEPIPGSQDHLVIFDIHPDPSNMGLWLGTDWGLYFFNTESEEFSVFFPEKFPGDTELQILSLQCNIYEDPDGTWWVGLGRWLYTFDPVSRSFKPFYLKIADYPEDKDINQVYTMVDPSNSNRLWIDFEGEGIMVLDKNQLASQWVLQKKGGPKLMLPIIKFRTLDKNGNFWAGSKMNGLIIVNYISKKFSYSEKLSKSSLFNTPFVAPRSIDISPDHKIWIGGFPYMYYYDLDNNIISPNLFQVDQCFDLTGQPHTEIELLKVDPNGDVWTSSFGSCIRKFNPETETYRIYQVFDNDQGHIISFLWDSLGFAWIANASWGIARLDPETGESVKFSIGEIDSVNHLSHGILANNGEIFYCGSYGVKKFEIIEDKNKRDIQIDNYRFTDHIPPELYEDKIGPGKDAFGLNPTHVFGGSTSAFKMDKKRNLWIGTSENGVMRYDPVQNSVRFYTRNEGLASNTIFELILDDKDRIWIGCDYGLSCIYPQTGKIVNFYENDGLISAYFHFNNLPYANGSAKDKNGNIYFATLKGVVYFNPDEVLGSIIEHPNLVISSLYINNKPISSSITDGPIDSPISYLPNIHLKYTDKLISLQYSVPEYTDRAKRIRYQHKLEGFDNQWIDAENRTFITYSNIPPGKYKLKINASTTYNFYEADAVSLNIFMAPPPWATWWAYTLYVLFVLGTIWGFISWRTREQKRKLREVEKVNTRLREVDQLKDQFLANTSHELRTPLQGIIGLAESLKDRLVGKLSKTAVEDLDMINSSGKRLANLVNDILDFSKLKKHDLELQLKPVDIRTIVEVVFSVLQPLIKTKDLELTYEVPADLPLVLADENRLQQILHNLLGNAIKFTEKGSVQLTAEAKEEMVAIHITDTGIGIPNDKQKSIFKSFEQANGGISREYGGTGLGLSVTRQLVKLHSGKIKIDSEPGKGSMFSFTLPISDGKKVIEKEKADSVLIKQYVVKEETEQETMDDPLEIEEIKSSPLNGRIDILVVDDEPVNLQVLKNHLSLAGYHVTLANNGMEAIDLIEKGHKCDLVILDIMMPKLSGYEVCQKLRKLFLPSELPVVMLTAKNQVINLVEGFKTGANDYLTKPFSKDELLSRIKTHLNLHRINGATGKFVPYEFLKAIGRDSITEVTLGDQVQKDVSILFLDILGYTSLSENMTPEENFLFINEFVGQLGPVIAENNGFVNQYIGDAIMAIFPGKAENGLEAAVEMQIKLDEFNSQRIKESKKEIRMGIGLHSGPLIMGIIGDKHHTEPTTISDTVNISSRLEGLTRKYGVRIIVSESSIQQMKELEKFHLRYLGQVLVKGKQKPIKMYECVDGDKEAILKLKTDLQKDFDKGLDLFYNKEFPEASVVFNNIIKENDNDHAARFFYNRAAKFALKGVPKDWTGIEKWDMK